jgi:hypothetical protein
LALWVVLLGMTGWAALAVYYADLSGRHPRTVAAVAVAAAALAALLFVRRPRSKPRGFGRLRPDRLGLAAFALLFAGVLGWFLSLKPLSTRDWADSWAYAPNVDIEGERLTVHHVRNFDYQSEEKYTAAWVDRTYDLNELKTVDLALCYWGSHKIAHAIACFGFADGRYLSISIETRRQKSESFSAVQGFFRQYELVYVFAEERDSLRLRTNYRHEHLYLYRTNATPEQARKFLLSYVRAANELYREPQWYNAATSNCVTNVWELAREDGLAARFNWKILVSGYTGELLYERGRLDRSLPFAELEAKSRIDDAALAADAETATEFSRRIRIGLPGVEGIGATPTRGQ